MDIIGHEMRGENLTHVNQGNCMDPAKADIKSGLSLHPDCSSCHDPSERSHESLLQESQGKVSIRLGDASVDGLVR